MRNFLRITAGVDVMPLRLAITRRKELWNEDSYLRDYPQGPFGEVESIILRFPEKSVKETQAEVEAHLATHDQHENVDQPIYAALPEARKLVMDLMAYVAGERLGRVMINKLVPGGRIFPHADTPSHVAYYTRFHICIASSPGYLFRCGDERVYMAPGEIWWFDNGEEHEVINNGSEDRISMVVDIRTSR